MQSTHEPEPILQSAWYIRILDVPRKLRSTYEPDSFYPEPFKHYGLARDAAQEHLTGCFVCIVTGAERSRGIPGIRRRRMRIHPQGRRTFFTGVELKPERWYILVDEGVLLAASNNLPFNYATYNAANAMIRERNLMYDARAVIGGDFPSRAKIYTTQAPE